MRGLINRLLDVPTLDPDKTRKARLLNILLLGMGFLAFLAIVMLLFFISSRISGWENLLPTFWSVLIFLFCVGFVFVINRKSYVLIAGSFFVLVLTGALTFSNIEAVGAGTTLFYFVIPILISSVLIRPEASFVMAGITSLIFVLVALYLKLVPDFYIGILGMFAIAVVSWLTARTLENALRDLRQTNAELDQRVEQRTQELAEANRSLETQAQELAKTNERLQELDGLKSKFVSDVSHELRTPISNLSIYLEMLEDGNARNTTRYLAILREEASRLKKLVDDVLDLSRMEMGTVEPPFEWRCINDIAEQVFIANQLRADVKGLRMEFTSADDLPRIYMDGDQMIQALNNLVGNSVNYTEKGHVFVRTFHDVSTAHVVVEISDTGMGIAEDDITHIFDRFYRGKRAGQSAIPGTGLGLAITKEIVERHNGNIQVTSKVESGTKFIVRLPVEVIS